MPSSRRRSCRRRQPWPTSVCRPERPTGNAGFGVRTRAADDEAAALDQQGVAPRARQPGDPLAAADDPEADGARAAGRWPCCRGRSPTGWSRSRPPRWTGPAPAAGRRRRPARGPDGRRRPSAPPRRRRPRAADTAVTATQPSTCARGRASTATKRWSGSRPASNCCQVGARHLERRRAVVDALLVDPQHGRRVLGDHRPDEDAAHSSTRSSRWTTSRS